MSEHNDTVTPEVWKEIPGYQGLYEVSSIGRVRSLDRVFMRRNGLPQTWDGKLLRPQVNPKSGRINVHLCDKDHHRRCIEVHRLVLLAFVGPCPDGLEACHTDDNCKNNTIGNLRWDTKRSNYEDRDRNGKTRCGEKNGASKATEGMVRTIRQLSEQGMSFNRIAKVVGISRNQVTNIARRVNWKHVA